jgi:hypothetical protein
MVHAAPLAAALLAAVALPAGQLPAADRPAGPIEEDLAALKDYESHRITSVDPTGGNRDFRELEPGKTLVLADIRGPGRIVHLRDNITSREPHHLCWKLYCRIVGPDRAETPDLRVSADGR